MPDPIDEQRAKERDVVRLPDGREGTVIEAIREELDIEIDIPGRASPYVTTALQGDCEVIWRPDPPAQDRSHA